MAGLIQIVDENDKPIGSAEKKDAWANGKIHRVARIMLYDPKGRLLLQRRVKTADIWPNCWTYSASGHVDAGEDYKQAAERELAEELGLTNVDLEKVAHGYTEPVWGKYKLKRFTQDFRGFIDETPENFDPGEVSGVRWFSQDELLKRIKDHPEEFTPSISEKKWLEYK